MDLIRWAQNVEMSDMHSDFVDAEAFAAGVSREEMIIEILRGEGMRIAREELGIDAVPATRLLS